MAIYEVWGFDVWGNAADGYEVNDRFRLGAIDIREEADDAEIIKDLFGAGYLNTAGARHFTIGGGGDVITIDRSRDGKPQLSLERRAGGKVRKRRGGKRRATTSGAAGLIAAATQLKKIWR